MSSMYRTITKMTTFGPYVKKIILALPAQVNQSALALDTFSVYVERRLKTDGSTLMKKKGWLSDETYPSKGYCEIVDAYPADAEGNKQVCGSNVCLELAYDFSGRINAEIEMIEHHSYYVFCDFNITQIKPIVLEKEILSGMQFNQFMGGENADTNGWINRISKDDKMPLKYGFYTPDTGNDKHPLIIWLHGGGEGGQETTVAYTSNKATNLSSLDIQTLFDGAYILVPQSPTMWMDDGSQLYGDSGQSIYVDGLMALIDEFINLHADIDRSRIYLGGCSNGGYMTMRLVVDYPDYFAAAFPVCEALYNKRINDEQIERIKHIPIWFTQAKNDTIVKPDETVVPTYQRLIAAGAPDVHFTYFEKVYDNSGDFVDEHGGPKEFFGHATWVNALNNDCRLDFDGSPVTINGQAVTLFEWLATQKKN